jgi:phosphate-selective porin OprO/OprP
MGALALSLLVSALPVPVLAQAPAGTGAVPPPPSPIAIPGPSFPAPPGPDPFSAAPGGNPAGGFVGQPIHSLPPARIMAPAGSLPTTVMGQTPGVPVQVPSTVAQAPAGVLVGESQALTPAEVQQMIDAAIKKDRDGQKKKTDDPKTEESLWYTVGSDLNIKARFTEGGYLWLSTPKNDFTMHIGAWVHYDNVFWDQSGGLRVPPGARPGPAQGVASGVAAGGIGNLEDGTFFRRLRPFIEGTVWEVYEYRLNFALENDQFSTSGLDEFWVGVNKLPAIGTIRIGHVKTPMGLEADMTASSRAMTFMERSSYSEAILLNQNFVTGIWFGNAFLDQRTSYQAALFRSDQGSSSGAFFGDGQWGAQARLTALPLWECEGRHWLHLGISGGWRNGTNNIATSPFRTFQLRARPELRDDDPAGSPAGAQVIPNADSNRMIDTGLIAARNDFLLGLEFLYVRGPFSFQAEYGWNFLDGAFGVAPTGLTLNPAIVPAQNYTFDGGYVQLAYTLTGESRAYDKFLGTLARDYFGPKGNFTNAWLVRDENGRLSWGWGAWEVAARYSYTNLNSGSGPNRIQGGQMNGYTLGLNWYLCNNVKCQFDWVYDHRYNVPVGTFPGYTSGYGMRVQLSF